MTKTLRASVTFPLTLHTAIKVDAANSRITLTEYVLRAVEASGGISNRAVDNARSTLVYDGRVIRSTVKFPCKVAYLANDRAAALDMSPSEFIAAVVAHKLGQNGK